MSEDSEVVSPTVTVLESEVSLCSAVSEVGCSHEPERTPDIQTIGGTVVSFQS